VVANLRVVAAPLVPNLRAAAGVHPVVVVVGVPKACPQAAVRNGSRIRAACPRPARNPRGRAARAPNHVVGVPPEAARPVGRRLHGRAPARGLRARARPRPVRPQPAPAAARGRVVLEAAQTGAVRIRWAAVRVVRGKAPLAEAAAAPAPGVPAAAVHPAAAAAVVAAAEVAAAAVAVVVVAEGVKLSI
jgi:hypothetical protein